MECENSCSRTNHIGVPQCYAEKATRKVTVIYTKYGLQGEHDTLDLCEACAKAVLKDAHRYGYRVRTSPRR